jgi:hypothetical protein
MIGVDAGTKAGYMVMIAIIFDRYITSTILRQKRLRHP